MIDLDGYFKFYNSCVPVKGFRRGLIYDLQRGYLYFMPNSVIDMLLENKNNKLSQLYNQYEKQKELVNKYLNFLIENELIFLTNKPDHFAPLNLNFKPPLLLDILFIEIDTLLKPKMDLLKNIDSLGCVKIILISCDSLNLKNIETAVDILKFSKIEIITVITEYEVQKVNKLIKIQGNNLRLRNLVLFNSPTDKESNTFIKYSSGSLKDILQRRISNINDLVLNQKAYIEALNYNLFFNRKIYIDDEGNIKHYFNEEKIYGNIQLQNIKKIVASIEFGELWNIKKDQIVGCKECEFRYICPDNRIPIKKNDYYEHKTVCNYNPKTSIWK